MSIQNALRIIIPVWLWLLLVPAAYSQLKIDIVGGGANQIPIAIVPFRAENTLPQKVTDIVAADLSRSGLFKMVDGGGLTVIPAEPVEVQYGTWKSRGADALVIGSVSPLPNGSWDVRFRLLDVAKQNQLLGFAYQVTAQQLRSTAHKIADAIYEKLTGDPGVFSTRITYIVKNGTRFELQVADARVRGLEGVRVIDTSIMPFLVAGNTAAPAMAMAWRAADLVLADGNLKG